MTVRLEVLPPAQQQQVLADLARLRITVFREFPYLYDGDLAYEQRYLHTYLEAPDFFLAVVRDGERVVGATTALPLEAETAELQAPFRAAGIDPAAVFYFGESVLLPEYRGMGFGRQFLELREARARELGRQWAAFCAVDRPADHPRRPQGYRPLDALWDRQGFVRRPDLTTTMTWQDLDEPAESPKRMVFWTKFLTAGGSA
ncbi:GNAT superfamily N-acetyltransferase [Deinobacterium chartae]|uniref:GNAT superfamily N-acetyltransferase n=1 Tax=Deinobacterium chartae TaxID=521158 RepID=A0A841HZU4_9DEIO|nr:GNAT family N-acetyltransferase [Deinobacterium chartae]MBB6098386.1 GNAT superfamily N-acetyltransferase [Deinobacterium chartae]